MNCIFDRTTGRFLEGAKWDIPTYEPASQVLVVLPAFPNPRTERLNQQEDGVRAATPQEIADYDSSFTTVILDDIIEALDAANILPRTAVEDAARGRGQ